ncbi:preprotein translocase subunit SecE [Intestinimonas massiliensis (ex Afouda et al. 2020)]|uniref:preprotein translocase subunit SecE n=1 Tax=Intestinimonas massiliensis (ex Afouda et al. 2020) TaxID=1673721 RepID=UPI0010319115|nr:preprotein translocase subunit SecE [Intestinimonas massiliensis (ex Afouda et al. 2020)]
MSENEKLEQAAENAAPAPEKPAKTEKKKDVKAEKKSKPGFFARIGKWFKEMKSELKKVQWPTRKQTINNTVIVIVCCIIVGICIWVFDALAGSVITALLDLFGKG